jgi:purine-binding chemotaxis protein CheW
MEISEKSVEDELKYLMFYLNQEHYGIPILKVNEIIGLMTITPIPKTPNFLKGIINLRGKIIPVLDLRIKFSMEERAYDEQTCIIIVEVFISDIKRVIGIVVDKVAEVVKVYRSDIELPPQYGQESDGGFLTGVGKVKDKVVMLLDIERIVNCKEMAEFIKGHEKIENDGIKGE